jgi:hypothetical protein
MRYRSAFYSGKVTILKNPNDCNVKITNYIESDNKFFYINPERMYNIIPNEYKNIKVTISNTYGTS